MSKVTAETLTDEQIGECMKWAVQSGRYLLVEACATCLVKGKRRRGAVSVAKRHIAAAINARAKETPRLVRRCGVER